MDTKTIEKIIAMLDARIETAQYEYLDAYTEFREHLRKLTVIHTELNLENDYDQDMYDIMNEINEQDRLKADEESRLGQED